MILESYFNTIVNKQNYCNPKGYGKIISGIDTERSGSELQYALWTNVKDAAETAACLNLSIRRRRILEIDGLKTL